MAVRDEVVLARADVNDAYGVTVWQRKKIADYTVEQAERLGSEILQAAAEARRVAAEDAIALEPDACGERVAESMRQMSFLARRGMPL